MSSNPIPALTAQQIAGMYSNQQNGAGIANQSQYAQQLQLAALINQTQQQYNQHIQNLGKVKKPKQFMIEGKEMDLMEFVNTLYPEDCPEKTFLLLKLKGE